MSGNEIILISQIKGLGSVLSELSFNTSGFSGNFSLTYTDGKVTRKTYSTGNYIDISYNIDSTIKQKKYYLADETLYETKTAQYDNNLFIGWI